MPTIGILVTAIPGSEKFSQVFEKDMRELGYVEGQSVHFEYRQGPVSGLPELAAELVRLKVDLIVTWFTPAALAAKQATRDISIVMARAGNPGGNRTGREPCPARWEYHRHGPTWGGIGWQMRRADP